MALTINRITGASRGNRQIVFAGNKWKPSKQDIETRKHRVKEYIETDVLPRSNPVFRLFDIIPDYDSKTGKYCVVISYGKPPEMPDRGWHTYITLVLGINSSKLPGDFNREWQQVVDRLDHLSNLTHLPEQDRESDQIKVRHYNMRLDGLDTLLIVQPHYNPASTRELDILRQLASSP